MPNLRKMQITIDFYGKFDHLCRLLNLQSVCCKKYLNSNFSLHSIKKFRINAMYNFYLKLTAESEESVDMDDD